MVAAFDSPSCPLLCHFQRFSPIMEEVWTKRGLESGDYWDIYAAGPLKKNAGVTKR